MDRASVALGELAGGRLFDRDNHPGGARRWDQDRFRPRGIPGWPGGTPSGGLAPELLAADGEGTGWTAGLRPARTSFGSRRLEVVATGRPAPSHRIRWLPEGPETASRRS